MLLQSIQAIASTLILHLCQGVIINNFRLIAELPAIASPLIMEHSQVGQPQFALGDPELAVPRPLLVLHVLGNGFQEDLIHNLPKY